MDYRVSGESLTAVADAIRAKAGTTEAMAFPDGFVNEVLNMSAGEKWELLEEFTADGTVQEYVRTLGGYGLTDAGAVLLECIYPICPNGYGIYNSINFNRMVDDGNPNCIFNWASARTDTRTRFALLVDKTNGIAIMRSSDNAQNDSNAYGANGDTVVITGFREIQIRGYPMDGVENKVPAGTIVRIYARGGARNG